MKMLFGETLYKKMKSTKLKSIKWKGLDITTSSILATFPNIKERFSDEWIEYFKERNHTVLELFMQSVFHYGYQQSEDTNEPNRKVYHQMIENIIIYKKNMQVEMIKAQIDILNKHRLSGEEKFSDTIEELEQQLRQLEDETKI